MKSNIDILDLFRNAKSESRYLKVAAPMVRYSKLEFRNLLRIYGAELCFTPMIIADSFCRSCEARNNEFTTNEFDTPLIAQFAAKNCHEFATAAELISPYVDGVDLNCGCPQKWAIAKGYGCALLKNPQELHSMIRTLRNRIPQSQFSCSYKIRLLQATTPRTTVELCRQLEATGLTFLTVHGRTAWQRNTEPVNSAALAELKQSLQIPLIYNGNCKKLEDAELAYANTQCDGVMAARGLLSNPTLFAGTSSVTTLDCIANWCELAAEIQFQTFHHHLTFMLEKLLTRKLRTEFNEFTGKAQIYEFLEREFKFRIRDDDDDDDDDEKKMKKSEQGFSRFIKKKNLECDYSEKVLLEFKNLPKVKVKKKPPDDGFAATDNGKFYNLYKEKNLEAEAEAEDDVDLLNTTLFDL